jgi:hypothetical protein
MNNAWAIDGLEDYVPSDIGAASKHGEGWNWGAFFCPGVWGFFHGAYLWSILYWVLFLFFFPGSWGVAIYLGVKGNQIALNNRAFKDLYDFEGTEKAWQYWGGAVFCLVLLIEGLRFLVLNLIGARWYGIY